MKHKLISARLILVAVSLTMSISSQAATILSDLRLDYDTPLTPHTNGQDAVGKVPDSFGTGNWNYFARQTAAITGIQTPLVYDTSASSVRAANAYTFPAGILDLPALSNANLITPAGSEGSPAADELALHPGTGTTSFLVMRWTVGSGEAGMVNVAGAIRDLGVVFNGVTLQIFNQAGTSLFGSSTTSGNAVIPFLFDTTVATGDFIDFVVGPNGEFSADQSALKVTITLAPEPNRIMLIMSGTVFLLARRSRRKDPFLT